LKKILSRLRPLLPFHHNSRCLASLIVAKLSENKIFKGTRVLVEGTLPLL